MDADASENESQCAEGTSYRIENVALTLCYLGMSTAICNRAQRVASRVARASAGHLLARGHYGENTGLGYVGVVVWCRAVVACRLHVYQAASNFRPHKFNRHCAVIHAVKDNCARAGPCMAVGLPHALTISAADLFRRGPYPQARRQASVCSTSDSVPACTSFARDLQTASQTRRVTRRDCTLQSAPLPLLRKTKAMQGNLCSCWQSHHSLYRFTAFRSNRNASSLDAAFQSSRSCCIWVHSCQLVHGCCTSGVTRDTSCSWTGIRAHVGFVWKSQHSLRSHGSAGQSPPSNGALLWVVFLIFSQVSAHLSCILAMTARHRSSYHAIALRSSCRLWAHLSVLIDLESPVLLCSYKPVHIGGSGSFLHWVALVEADRRCAAERAHDVFKPTEICFVAAVACQHSSTVF